MNQSPARPFKQVDVFTAAPYRGNPVAVVLDGSGLSDPDHGQLERLGQKVGGDAVTCISGHVML